MEKDGLANQITVVWLKYQIGIVSRIEGHLGRILRSGLLKLSLKDRIEAMFASRVNANFLSLVGWLIVCFLVCGDASIMRLLSLAPPLSFRYEEKVAIWDFLEGEKHQTSTGF